MPYPLVRVYSWGRSLSKWSLTELLIDFQLIFFLYLLLWVIHICVSVLFTLFDVTWVMHGRVTNLLVCWHNQRGNSSVKEVSRIAQLCLMWTIWRERNAKCFEDQENMLDELKRLFIRLSSIGQTLLMCLSFILCLNFWLYVLFAFRRDLSLYTSCVLRLHPSALFNELLIYKN
jgi:hypothetical protein